MSIVAAVVAAPWITWAIVRAFGLEGGDPLVAAVAFTPYAAFTSLLPVVFAALLRRWVITALAAVAAAVLIGAVVPRGLSNDAPSGSRDGITLTVMSLNLDDGHADPAAIMRLVREHDVDLLSLQETKFEAVERLDVAGARKVLPGRLEAPQARAGGSALLASGELRLHGVRGRSSADQPAATIVSRDHARFVIEVVHPPPPTNATRVDEWRSTLRALQGAGGPDNLRILAGDFNATLDHQELRRVLDRGYADAADAAGAGLHPTFPSQQAHGFGIAIDHVLVDRRIAVRSFTTHVIPRTDHRAIVARLALPAKRP